MRVARTAALCVVLGLVPLAAAHGGPPPSYDPLLVSIDGWLTSNGKIAPAPPDKGQVCFKQVAPMSAATPLTFTEGAPVAFSPTGGMRVIIELEASSALASTQDSDGQTLRLTALYNGTAIDGMTQDWHGQEAYTPGESDRISMTLTPTTNVTFVEGGTVTLQITPLMPVLAGGSLCLVVGESQSSASFPLAMVPTVYDLHLNDPALQQYDMVTQNATYADPGIASNDIEVFHDHIQTNYVTFLTDKAYVNMKGAELSTDAEQYHAYADTAERLNATHDFLVAGTFVRVHPGVGTVLLVDLSKVPAGQNYLACIRNCPQPLNMTLLPYHSLQSPTSTGTDLRVAENGVTTPTTGTTSIAPHAPNEKKTAGFELIALLTGALTTATRRRRP